MGEGQTKSAVVTWLAGMTFDAAVRDHHLMIDAAGGFGHDRGPTPMDLLLVGLAGCTAMDVVSILGKSRQPFDGLAVRIEGERAPDHPRRYTRVVMTYEVHGDGVDRAAVERAVSLSEERYCSVQATLRQAPEIVTRIALVGSAPEVVPPG